jgi:asparagine synthase (glutamine-hydrolysing)
LVWHYDEPFADSSAIPTFYLSQLTRRHVTIALSGDGGDELFVGYPRYQAVRLAARFDRLPAPVRSLLASRAWQHVPSSGRRKDIRRLLKRFLHALAMSPQRRYAEWLVMFNEERRANLYTDEFIAELPDRDPLELLLAAYARSRQRDIVTSTALTDLVTYLPCDLCQKVDIASMANSLECRQPMLDHRVVEHAVRLPLAEKLRGRRGKRILREAFGHLLPSEVFTRPKMGFGVPLDYWFRGELREMLRETLLDTRATQRGFFRPQAVEQLLTELDDGTFNHAERLWTLLILELWHREWID